MRTKKLFTLCLLAFLCGWQKRMSLHFLYAHLVSADSPIEEVVLT